LYDLLKSRKTDAANTAHRRYIQYIKALPYLKIFTITLSN